MRALIGATDARLGDNVVDMRGLAMARLEARLDRLEDTHRAVVANAYDNLAGTNQIHRCVLALIGCATLPELLDALAHEAASTLRLASVRLVLEGEGPAPHTSVRCVPAGGVARLVEAAGGNAARAVALRGDAPADPSVHATATIRSEALLTLDLGPGRAPALLALGSTDPALFRPGQGTDLLAFLGNAVARLLRRALAP